MHSRALNRLLPPEFPNSAGKVVKRLAVGLFSATAVATIFVETASSKFLAIGAISAFTVAGHSLDCFNHLADASFQRRRLVI